MSYLQETRSDGSVPMEFFITGDVNRESGVLPVLQELSPSAGKHFRARTYGLGLDSICVVLMCRGPELAFKRRVRFVRKQKAVYLDIMLELDEMRKLDHQSRKRRIAARLAAEIPAVLQKYSITEFDESRFGQDLKAWLKESGA